jgi:C-terminal processing protease CtpA/Prc
LSTKERESLIQRVSKVVEERIWDPVFPRHRWHAAVGEQRTVLLNNIDMVEFEQRMDALVRHAGDLLSVKSYDLGFFHKSRRKTRSSPLASHFRYCQPNECSPALTRASVGGDVLYSKLNHDTGWLKVTKFPGAVGVEIANQMAQAVRGLAGCSRLIVDLRGNESGGLAFLRLAGYLTPDRRTIGYSVTRHGAERASMETLKTFDWIPSGKFGLPWLAVKYGLSDPSVRVATEGLGPHPFHGRTVLLVDEATTGAGERIAAFVTDEHLAPIVGVTTAGQVICSDLRSVGNDFFVRIPGRAWYTPARRLIEGTGIVPDVHVKQGEDPRDSQLERAKQVVASL